MAEDSDLEKTEPATPKRIEKAREDGQVARSQELTTFAVLMAAAVGLWFLGAGLLDHLSNIMIAGMQMEREIAYDTSLMLIRLNQLAVEGLWALGPLLLLLLIVAFFAPMLLSGWLFGSKALLPDFKRLNPVQGFTRVFSVRGLIELVKAIAKALIIGGVGMVVMWHNKDTMLALVTLPVDLGVNHMSQLLGFSFLFIVGAMTLIVAIDVPFQIWEHAKKLRMTKEEVRKETKETEGDHQIKARIRGSTARSCAPPHDGGSS
jgi:flagellar biosynthesis protein FlhB